MSTDHTQTSPEPSGPQTLPLKVPGGEITGAEGEADGAVLLQGCSLLGSCRIALGLDTG